MREQIAPGRFSSPKNGLGPRLVYSIQQESLKQLHNLAFTEKQVLLSSAHVNGPT